MRTWLMYKNHHGRDLPAPKYQSDFRDNKINLSSKKSGFTGKRLNPTDRVDPYPIKALIQEQLFVLGILLLFLVVMWIFFPGFYNFFF